MNGWSAFLRDLLEQMPLILTGVGETLKLTVAFSITGLALGIVVFYLSLSRHTGVRRAIQAYISFFIGMPLIVLLFLMYYGLPQWGISPSPFMVAVIGFTFNVAAYNAAYLTTAYNGLDYLEIEAAKAQGFNHLQIFRFVILPQVLRLSVPALTNQVIRNLKDSSVAFLIQYTEFFARVQELAATNFQFFQAYLFAALVYLAFVSVIVVAARYLEKRVIIPGGSR
ncbi:MAG: amino acid ABC transporter permease [Sulfuricella sp.]|nr:amino acid ABC transporter permease [Sulfuricella sp.]